MYICCSGLPLFLTEQDCIILLTFTARFTVGLNSFLYMTLYNLVDRRENFIFPLLSLSLPSSLSPESFPRQHLHSWLSWSCWWPHQWQSLHYTRCGHWSAGATDSLCTVGLGAGCRCAQGEEASQGDQETRKTRQTSLWSDVQALKLLNQLPYSMQ